MTSEESKELQLQWNQTPEDALKQLQETIETVKKSKGYRTHIVSKQTALAHAMAEYWSSYNKDSSISPADYIDNLQDTIHTELGKYRAAKSIKICQQ